MKSKTSRLLLIPVSVILILSVVLVVIPAAAANTVANPSIESGSGANADNWSESYGGRVDTMHHTGSWSMQLNETTGTTWRQMGGTLSGIQQSTTYYISYYLYRTDTDGEVYLKVTFPNVTCDTTADTTTGQWKYYSNTCTTTSDVSSVTVAIWFRTTTGNDIWFDDVCVSSTASDCANGDLTSTPTASNTPTQTYTPTETYTPTQTFTPTETFTPTTTLTLTNTNTPTLTNTPTQTRTPTGTWSTPTVTFTPTVTPPGSLTWAESEIEPEAGIVTALEVMIVADPPAGATTLWGITDAAASSSGWYFSLVNLDGVPSPYDVWNVEDNAYWLGSAECIDDSGWSCEWYEPSAPVGGGSGLAFPWRSGESAVYGQNGVHSGGWGTEYALDFFPTSNETYASEDGIVTWVCTTGVYNTGIKVSGGSGDILYLHLEPGTPASVGDEYRQGDYIGNLVRGTFSDTCGWADQNIASAHVHFGFDADTYYNIGGCVLTISTEIFDCDGTLIGILESLLNNGESSDPGDGTGTGGVHIWDGIVAAIVDLLFEDMSDYLPTQHPSIPYWLQQGMVVFSIILNVYVTFILGPSGMISVVMVMALTLVVTVEIGYFVAKNILTLVKFGKSILKLLALFL